MGTTAQIGNIGPFDVLAFSWGIQYAAISDPSNKTQAQLSDVVITKLADENSAPLYQACANGTPFDSATITMTADGGAVRVYQFNSVFVNSVQQPSAQDPSYETVDWNFGKVSINFSSMDDPDTASGGSSSGSLGQVDAISGAG